MTITPEASQKIESTLDSYPALRALFGDVLLVRFAAANPDCYLLRCLGNERSHTLDFWEERCELFLKVVANVAGAALKINEELTGPAKNNTPDEFNGRLGDCFLEICVVHDLAKRGCYKFLPIMPCKSGKKTVSAPDYQCYFLDDDRQERLAYVEVKNLRAPVGLIDSFNRLLAELSSTHPFLREVRIALHHYWDNTASPEQDSAMREFLLSLEDIELPYAGNLILPGDVEVHVNAESGRGDVVLTRSLGGDYPWGPFTEEEAFFKKATATIRKAVSQLSQYPEGIRMLAMNVESPDGIFSGDVGMRLQQLVKEESQGAVECILFHHHRFLEA